ncbi:MAG: energy-coupling factor transporter transmembrane component T [Candidatus Enterosoma sp.]|nr:energy-coupling factor transporter transmembrane component T [Candidatus Enterosoma sp.]
MTSFGRYSSYHTVIHRIDCRVKLMAMILFLVSVFLNYGTPWMNLVIYGGIFIVLLSISLVAKASFLSLFRSLKALWFMIFLLLLINVLFNGNDNSMILFTIPFNAEEGTGVAIRLGAIINVVYIFVRLVLVLMVTNILTQTTKPMELTASLEWLFYPLKLIHIPVHKFAMALSLALRFVPTLQEQTSRIMKAQASRGVDYKQGKFKEKIKALVSLIIPLFMSAFLTSGELADAMEARGYDPDGKRTKFKTDTWGMRDAISVIFLCLFTAGFITLAVLKPDLFAALNISVPAL